MAGLLLCACEFGLAFFVAWKLWSLINNYVLKPRAIRASFLGQGITGPPALPMLGNILQILDMRAKVLDKDFHEITHDIVDHILPDLKFYSKAYGKDYLIWMGDEPSVFIQDPDLVREVLCKKTGHFGRTPLQRKFLEALIGSGILVAEGEDWAQRRRIMSPAFHAEKLKAMVGTMTKCTLEMVENWEQAIEKQGSEAEIEVLEQLKCVTADVISHTAFGSSYEKGKKVFELLCSLALVSSKAQRLNWLPGARFIPIPSNLQIRSLKKQLNSVLEEVLKARRKSANYGEFGSDLLGLMLREIAVGEKSHGKFGDEKLIEECKTFYFAGQETTTALLTWILMLLANHPFWQDLSRKEVQEICKDNLPNAEMVSKLKIVTMVINETLRLYPPVILVAKGASKSIDLGRLFVPKGTGVFIPIVALHHDPSLPIVALHHDPSLWGSDVNEFNPNRFANGVAHACKHPMAFIPFADGPRVCIGQAFAVLEAKILLAIILSRFKFRISPSYIHNPAANPAAGAGILQPHHGMPIIFKRL